MSPTVPKQLMPWLGGDAQSAKLITDQFGDLKSIVRSARKRFARDGVPE